VEGVVMRDLLDRLREQSEWHSDGHGELYKEAVAEIERLRFNGREAIAVWMDKQGYATGHGDTIEDLLVELEGQSKHPNLDNMRAEIERLRAALEAVDSDYALTGHLKEIVDDALGKTERDY
jgi:hypothetical protein